MSNLLFLLKVCVSNMCVVSAFRILYSKMLARTSGRSGGSGQLRRSLVLRFLAGCHENEMLLFVEMAFKVYAKYFNGMLSYNTCSIGKQLVL